MTTMPQDLRTLIIGSTSVTGLISTRCHYNKDAPMSSAKPFVWFRTTSDDEPLTMDGVGGMHEAYVDIECVGLTESSVQSVADAVKGRLHGYSGAMGNISAKGIFIASKDDDYVPFSTEGEEGEHVVAYEAHLWYTT
jgi:hypothetical protein